MDSGKLLWATAVSHLKREKQKSRVIKLRQTGTLVRSFSEVMWTRPTTSKTMVSGKLLWATGDSHLRREKQKKPSNYAATNRKLGAFVFRSNVDWIDNVENDDQRKITVDNWRQSPEARKAEKIE